MKRIEAIVPQGTTEDTARELMKLGVSGMTIYDSKGKGQIERPQVVSARGTAVYRPEFNVNSTIVLVVKDSVAEKVVQQILKRTSSGKAGEGKIFVSDVTEAFDIGSDKRGEAAI